MAYHNLYKTIAPPENLGSLLGLDLKFFIQSRRPSKNYILKRIKRMRRDIRMKYFFCGEEEANDYNPELYIKSDWNPSLANNLIETSLDNFEVKITSIRSDINLNCKSSTNISPTQEKLIHSTRNNKNIVRIQTDKNLGTATMEW